VLAEGDAVWLLSTNQNFTMMLDSQSIPGDSSEEEFEWEEVDVPLQIHETNPELELQLEGPAPRANIEITLYSGKKKDDSKLLCILQT
jgi:xeroderma pigmentosum group C-complementing protein